jgi:hypothetical protein
LDRELGTDATQAASPPLLADPETAARLSDPAAILAALVASIAQKEERGDDEIRGLAERRQEQEESQQLAAMRSEASHAFTAAAIGGSVDAAAGLAQGGGALAKDEKLAGALKGAGKALEGGKTLLTMSVNESVKDDQVAAKQHEQAAGSAKRQVDDATSASKERRDTAARALDQVKAFLDAAHQARMAPLRG